MENFARMRSLTYFDIGNATKVTDEGIIAFTSKVKKLTHLYLPRLQLKLAGIKAIADSK